MSKYVYSFGGGTADGDGTMKDTLGGKGSGLAEMSRAGLPVPPGFTIATDVCNVYFQEQQSRAGRHPERKSTTRLLSSFEKLMGQKLDDSANPCCFLSVRSGAKFSIAGAMMNTILNLGLNDVTTAGLRRQERQRAFRVRLAIAVSYRCFRRSRSGCPGSEKFDPHLRPTRKAKVKAKLDTDLNAEDLKAIIVENTRKSFRRKPGKPFPEDPHEQLSLSRDAVFRSWWTPKAKYYRTMEKIPDDIGTAANGAGDGVRQYGRHFRYRRGLHARSRFGRKGVLRRISDECSKEKML